MTLGPWYLSPTHFDRKELGENEQFLLLLTFARALNAVRFFHLAYLAVDRNDDKPSAKRQRVNAFFFMCGALKETLSVVDRLRRLFRDRQSFETELGEILRSSRFRRLRDKVLPRIRHKFAFHFDVDVARETLATIELPEYRFAEGFGKAAGDVYYTLADELAINYLLAGLDDFGSSEEERLRTVLHDVVDLSTSLARAGERLIGDFLKEAGWQMKQGG